MSGDQQFYEHSEAWQRPGQVVGLEKVPDFNPGFKFGLDAWRTSALPLGFGYFEEYKSNTSVV